jgi:hypothetical protein
MKITITLTERELQFLQNLQKLFNDQKTENQTRTKNSLEDVIHEIIGHAILLGESMHRGQA